MEKKELIKLIDWDKEWEDLSADDKANFLSLHGIQFLNNDNKKSVMRLYDFDRNIVEERGIEVLHLYI